MRITILVVALLAAFAALAGAQEVVIGGFPLGVGSSIDPEFWEPHTDALSGVADALRQHPEARAVIVGRADGTRYRDGNDAKNPGLSLGRAHALRNVLVDRFGVDSTQLLIQTSDVAIPGADYRSVSVRVEMAAEPPVVLAAAPPPAPVVVQKPAPEPKSEPIAVTEVNETNNYYDRMSLRLGIGASTSPFGGLPIVTGAVIWDRKLALNIVLGHTFWNDSYSFQGQNLQTWNRMVGLGITYYPWQDKPVGFVGGWVRVEEIAQSYYEYVRLSEGPALGVTVAPWKHVAVTGLYNPSRQRVEGTDLSAGKNGQFLLGISLFTDFGGGR